VHPCLGMFAGIVNSTPPHYAACLLAAGHGLEAIVDPVFAEQFAVAHPTERYAQVWEKCYRTCLRWLLTCLLHTSKGRGRCYILMQPTHPL